MGFVGAKEYPLKGGRTHSSGRRVLTFSIANLESALFDRRWPKSTFWAPEMGRGLTKNPRNPLIVIWYPKYFAHHLPPVLTDRQRLAAQFIELTEKQRRGERAVGWLESEVRDWLRIRVETSRCNQSGAN